MLIGDVFPFRRCLHAGARRSAICPASAMPAINPSTVRLNSVFPLCNLPYCCRGISAFMFGVTPVAFTWTAIPGGWHEAAGAGMWLGILSPATTLSLEGDSAAGDVLRLRLGLSF